MITKRLAKEIRNEKQKSFDEGIAIGKAQAEKEMFCGNAINYKCEHLKTRFKDGQKAERERIIKEIKNWWNKANTLEDLDLIELISRIQENK